jgi:hypothetical protein
MRTPWVIVWALALGLGDDGLENGGFEGKVGEDGAPAGWVLELGAQNGATTPESSVALDRKEKHGGKASLCFSGDGATRGWRILKQAVEVRPGGTYTLEAWTRTQGVKPNGFGLDNCYVGLFFFDADGGLVGRQLAFPTRPDSAWTKHTVTLIAPAATRKAYVYGFLSMLGSLWLDDLALSIEGGEALPAPERVFREDFAGVKRLPSEWKSTIGATNGEQGDDSSVALDAAVGAPDSPTSLRLSGNASTVRWTHLARDVPAKPGEIYRWSGLVRSADVHREGNQFANLHLNLAFLDAKGEALGPARFGSVEPGTHDWTPVEVVGVAPEGAKKARAGVFLSMTGDAWFDDLELTRENGGPPPYSDWITLEGKGVTLRHPPSHPHAAEMKAKLAELEQSKRTTCRALEVEFPETITVFLYLDSDQGRLLTGADLDFADPAGRRVHQCWESYIGHEMVHVIAHNTLAYGKTGILGEGLAVWLNGAVKNHHTAARELLEKHELPSMDDLVRGFREAKNAYPAAGSFCGFLIETYGLARFKELYPLDDPSARLAELEGKTFLDLEADWHAYLAKF